MIKNNIKTFNLLLLILLLIGCETKEFFPDADAPRDERLFGTWRDVDSSVSDSSFIVFTNEGYYGSTSYVNNAQINGFTNLDGLWYNMTIATEEENGKFYIACSSKKWANGKWEYEGYYNLSESNDTLIIGIDENSLNEYYVRNDYQLIFDGASYIGIDSTGVN